MSKYKTGDKVVLEIIQDDNYGDYKVGNKTHSWWNSHELLDNGSVPLSKYIKSMEEKLHNQRVEINRLLTENAKLKGENFNLSLYSEGCKCACEQARAAGQQEAWELARKISLLEEDGGYSSNELNEIFGINYLSEIFNLTYSEAAAKVAEWERKKEEICVGDVVEFTNGTKAVVIKVYEDGEVALLFSDGGYGTYRPHKNWHKTDRHIDISEWLAQIGGDCNE